MYIIAETGAQTDSYHMYSMNWSYLLLNCSSQQTQADFTYMCVRVGIIHLLADLLLVLYYMWVLPIHQPTVYLARSGYYPLLAG